MNSNPEATMSLQIAQKLIIKDVCKTIYEMSVVVQNRGFAVHYSLTRSTVSGNFHRYKKPDGAAAINKMFRIRKLRVRGGIL